MFTLDNDLELCSFVDSGNPILSVYSASAISMLRGQLGGKDIPPSKPVTGTPRTRLVF